MSTVSELAPATLDRPRPAPRRFPAWPRSDHGRTALVVLAWQALLTVVGYCVDLAFADSEQGRDPLAHLHRWDSGWFRTVLEGGYANNPHAPAFYPGFPLAVRLVRALTLDQLSPLGAGLLVNTVASWLAVTALLKISRHFLATPSGPWLVVTAFLGSGSAFFLHLFYSEALFVALGFWAYLFALRRQWTWMGLCLIPLTATRITAVLFVGLCFLEFWRTKDWKLRGLWCRAALWIPASLLGLLGYNLYLAALTGRHLAMFSAYGPDSDWPYHVFNPNIVATVGKEVGIILDGLTGQVPLGFRYFTDHLLPLIGLALLLAASGYLIATLRGRGVPLGVFGLASFVMFTLNSNVVSVNRYLLPCLGLYLALVLAVERRPRLRPVGYWVVGIGVLLQATLFAMIMMGGWAG